MSQQPATSGRRPKALLLLLLLPLGLWLISVAIPVNLKAACHWQQWPQLPGCDNPDDLPVERQVQDLREYLADNPGDSLAYADLARLAAQQETPSKSSRIETLRAAALTAPYEGSVLQLQAAQALQDSDWPTAVNRLVLLADSYRNPVARTALATLIARSGSTPGLLDALLSEAKRDQRWLESVVGTMPAEKIPVSSSVLLVGRLAQSNGLTPKLGRLLIKQLKAEGAWVDAHAIWLSLWRKPLGYLFNGDFEQAFISNAFDWEVTDNKPYQAGAQASQSNAGKHGQALLIKFTGRLIKTPIVRQNLILPPGEYRFEGEYQSTNLRSNEGLSWIFSCGDDLREVARSPALNRTGNNWERFNTKFRVREACGPLVKLSLQTQAAFEAKTGLRGEMMFDNFSVTRVTTGD